MSDETTGSEDESLEQVELIYVIPDVGYFKMPAKKGPEFIRSEAFAEARGMQAWIRDRSK